MDTENLKTLTASRLQFLQEMDAGILQGEESLKSVLEYLFSVTQSIPELIKASKTKVTWNLAVMVFGDDLDLADFKKFQEHIETDFKRIESASVEPTEKDGGGKD